MLAHPPTTPIPYPYTYWCGLWVPPGAPPALTQIVPNSSSLYTLFYSVIFNSVIRIHKGPEYGFNLDPDPQHYLSGNIRAPRVKQYHAVQR